MKFSSNEPEVLREIDLKRLASNIEHIDLYGGDFPEQNNLEIIWSPREDLLRVKISECSFALNPHGFLSFESSVFDLLGILDPFKLSAKLILRNLTEITKTFLWKLKKEGNIG